MTSVRRAVTMVLAAAGLLVAPGAAEPCSPPPPFGFGGVWPADGSLGVPTNVRPRWHHLGSSQPPELTDLLLQPVGGSPVPATVQLEAGPAGTHFVVVIAASPLAVDTTYELVGKVAPDPNCWSDCISADYVRFTAFTTGAGADATAPSEVGTVTATISATADVCDNGACCGPYVLVPFHLSWSAATDDGVLPLQYRVYRFGVAEPLVTMRGPQANAALACPTSPSFFLFDDFYGGSGTYVVRALDLAGNESVTGTSVAVVVECPSGVDAGVSADAASVTADAGAAFDGSGGGCGCRVGAHRRRLPWPSWVAAAAICIPLVRRSRAMGRRAAR
jgi:hypothetical protein